MLGSDLLMSILKMPNRLLLLDLCINQFMVVDPPS